MKCERRTNKTPCGRPATAFVMGQNVCAAHDTHGDTNCTHSLAPTGRCAHCGAHTERTP